jgi:hypothetical protein
MTNDPNDRSMGINGYSQRTLIHLPSSISHLPSKTDMGINGYFKELFYVLISNSWFLTLFNRGVFVGIPMLLTSPPCH